MVGTGKEGVNSLMVIDWLLAMCFGLGRELLSGCAAVYDSCGTLWSDRAGVTWPGGPAAINSSCSVGGGPERG